MEFMRIAIQGDAGSFHHLAANKFFGDDIDIVACQTFADVFACLANGGCDSAVVAIENSWYGVLPEVTDLLEEHPLSIIGELDEPIHQNLITLPGVSFSDIKVVMSHPVALEQCSKYLSTNLPDAKLSEYHDTAAAVEYIKDRGDSTIAAIAGSWPAELYTLPILAEKIENDPNNTTKFLMLTTSTQTSRGAS